MEIWVVRHREGLILDPTHPYVPATCYIAPKTTPVNRWQPYQSPLVNSGVLGFTKNLYWGSPHPIAPYLDRVMGKFLPIMKFREQLPKCAQFKIPTVISKKKT